MAEIAETPETAERVDVAVIGGGPAGLATAIGARLAGLSAIVLDRRQPPVEKACGEGLMPDAAACLAELGVRLPPGESHPIRGIRYVDGEVVADGTFPGAPGLGVRRLALHQALVDRAAEVGVELRWGVAVRGLSSLGACAAERHPPPSLPPSPPITPPRGEEPFALGSSRSGMTASRASLPPGRGRGGDGGRLGGGWNREDLSYRFLPRRLLGVETESGAVAARYVVGADGLLSSVRRWAGLDGPPVPPGQRRRFGVRRHYAMPPWSDRVEVHWGPGCEAYVTPVSPEEIGVAMLWSGPTRGFDDLLGRFPALAARLAGSPHTSRDRGAGPLLQRVRGVVRGPVALVGDASGYLDAITGEGLAVAFHQAAALVSALSAGDLARYAAAHRRIGRLPGFITGLVLACERRPALRRRAVAALAAEPALFSRLLGIHGRTLPARRLGLDGALRLAWRLVARPV